MSNKPNQPQINNAFLGEQSSLASKSQCPVCKTEYTESEVNRCSTCNWDLTLCSEGFVEKHNAQLAWAKEMWINLQAQEKQLQASQSQLEEVKQEKARFEGEVLHRLEQLEQAQDKSEPIIWAQMSHDNSKVNELEKQLLRIDEQLKGSERERQELKSKINQLSSQVAKFEAELQKKTSDVLPLISEAGIDYIRLQNCLVAGEWEKANNETIMILRSIGFRITGIDSISGDDNVVQQIPETDIQYIDQLWLNYSYGRFGFSVQKRIYQEVDENLVELGKKVGWLKYRGDIQQYWRKGGVDEYNKVFYDDLRFNDKIFLDDLVFSRKNLIGHLPMLGYNFYYDYKWKELQEGNYAGEQKIIYLFSKLSQPEIEQT